MNSENETDRNVVEKRNDSGCICDTTSNLCIDSKNSQPINVILNINLSNKDSCSYGATNERGNRNTQSLERKKPVYLNQQSLSKSANNIQETETSNNEISLNEKVILDIEQLLQYDHIIDQIKNFVDSIILHSKTDTDQLIQSDQDNTRIKTFVEFGKSCETQFMEDLLLANKNRFVQNCLDTLNEKKIESTRKEDSEKMVKVFSGTEKYASESCSCMTLGSACIRQVQSVRDLITESNNTPITPSVSHSKISCSVSTRPKLIKSCSTFFYNENNLVLERSEQMLLNNNYSNTTDELGQLEIKDKYYLNKKFNNELNIKYKLNRDSSNNFEMALSNFDFAAFQYKQNSSSIFFNTLNNSNVCVANCSWPENNDIALMNECDSKVFTNEYNTFNNHLHYVKQDKNINEEKTKQKLVEVIFPVKSQRSVYLDCTSSISVQDNTCNQSNNTMSTLNDGHCKPQTCVKLEERSKRKEKSNRVESVDTSINVLHESCKPTHSNTIKRAAYNSTLEKYVQDKLHESSELENKVVSILEGFLHDKLLISEIKGDLYDMLVIPKDTGHEKQNISGILSQDVSQKHDDFMQDYSFESNGTSPTSLASSRGILFKRRKSRRSQRKKPYAHFLVKRSCCRVKLSKLLKSNSANSYKSCSRLKRRHDILNKFVSLPVFETRKVNNTRRRNKKTKSTAKNKIRIPISTKRSDDFIKSPCFPIASIQKTSVGVSGDNNNNNNTFNCEFKKSASVTDIFTKMKQRKYKDSRYKTLEAINQFKKVLNEVELRHKSLFTSLFCDPCGFSYHFPTESKLFF